MKNDCITSQESQYIQNKRKFLIYISGAYMGKDNGQSIDRNIKLAREAAIEIWERGYTVICPHLNTQNFEKDCTCIYEDYLIGDCEIVKRCDGVFMLDNWKASNGASIEKQTAVENVVPIFFTMKELEEYYENTISHS
ncbi:MAG: DUF4406 domain-containing protein [Methanogenium sp.]|jgi:hypothetical protein